MFSLLFPGQGSQQVGMGKFLFEQFKVAQQTFEEGSDALGLDLKKLCFSATTAELALTENTQPALLVVSTATARVLSEIYGVRADIAAGHSVGEYAALVAADVLNFTDALKAVRARGIAMQSAVPVGQGGMTAVLGLDPVEAEVLCQYVERESGFSPLSPANYNSPGQIVISGSQKALDYLKTTVKVEDVFNAENKPSMKLISLQVSAPFHCSMMLPAEEKMRDFLGSIPFRDAQFDVIQNLTAQPHRSALEIRPNLVSQVSSPVKWMQSMETLRKIRSQSCIECGTGKVLQGLLKKIDSQAFKVFNTNSLDDLKVIESQVEDLARSR